MLHANGGFAQSHYRFFSLGQAQGLTSDFAWTVCQDKYNYIWIATQHGLNRYDGHHIKQYYHEENDPYSIPGNAVYWIYRDADDELWFCCGRKGLVKYNPAKDRFEKFAPFDSIKQKLNYPAPIWRMGNDQRGRIYFNCGGALFRYTKTSGIMEDLTPLFNGYIDNYGIAMILPQGNDVVWILADNGLYRYDLVAEKIRQISIDQNKFGFGAQSMHDAEFINDHDILISVARAGFLLFDTRTEEFKLPPAPFDPSRSRKFSIVGGVLKDSKGRIWLANSRYGLIEYHPSSNSTQFLKDDPLYPYPSEEQEGNGMNVSEDNNGNIWYCSSARGVIWFNPDRDFVETFQRDYAKSNSLPNDIINYFLPIEDQKFFIGTNKGLSEFNQVTKDFKNFPIAEDDKDINPHSGIRCMIQKGDSVFISTYIGLSVYNKRTRRFARFVDTSGIFQPGDQLDIHYISPGMLLLCGGKAARFNLNTKRYEHINTDKSDSLYALTTINISVLEDKTKTLWVGTTNGELLAYNTDNKKITRHIYSKVPAERIDAISIDEDGKLWLGSTQGLFFYDPVSKTSRPIILDLSRKEIFNIAIQNKEWAWLTTQKDIIRYNRISGSAAAMPISFIFPGSDIVRRAFMLDGNNFLWVGTTKGFCKVDITRFKRDNTTTQPELVNFSVFDKPQLFDKPYSEIDEINLKYNQNFFSLDISSFNVDQLNPGSYSYLLKGFDKDWQAAKTNSISYTNVPPGKYSLYLRSKTAAGDWIERKDPIVINIKPPFWQTEWFIGLMIAALMFIVYFIYRFAQKRKQNKRIDETIDYFANSLYGENSINEICWDIARNCISHLKLEDCVVYLLDEKRNVLIQKAAYGPKNPKEHEIIDPIEIKIGEGIVGTAAATAKPVLVKDTTKDRRYLLDDQQRFSELAVPIVHEGNVIGVIDSENSKKDFFNEGHVKALSTIAAICANKIAEAKAEEAAKQSQLQLLEIKKLLAESQLMALRAQMNPHFVFNCLNSIQECIVTEKYGEASLYLNKFSKLFRSVLNNSGKVSITLAEEIEVLELYLSLEHMRFEKSFEYKIEIDEELEKDEIMIPSMLLQPYVENALWHGLMHKNGDRRLDICFKKINEATFQGIIDDNGIGRKKAGELKELQSKTKRHVSRGMSISNDRIELLQKQGEHAVLNIIDKETKDGDAAGTRVVIELSTYLKG